MKFLSALLSFVALIYSEWFRTKAKQEVRESLQEQLDDNVEKAKGAISIPDPVRIERLRSRFDRSRSSE